MDPPPRRHTSTTNRARTRDHAVSSTHAEEAATTATAPPPPPPDDAAASMPQHPPSTPSTAASGRGQQRGQHPTPPSRRPSDALPPGMRTSRVQQACGQCRARKRRCDAMQPCQHCIREEHECVYTRSPNLKDNKLVQWMTTMGEKLERVSETVQRVDRAHRTTHQLLFSDSKDHVPAVRDHRTPAHHLIFLWPSIRLMLDSAQVKIRGDYVACAEDRPLLDPFTWRPAQRLSSEPARGHNLMATSTRSTPMPHSFSGQPSESRQRSSTNQGGLTADGGLDLNRNTAETLLASYLAHIHILHPFLNKQKLRVMMNNFLETFASEPARDDSSSSYRNPSPREHTRKRKRSMMEEEIGPYDTRTVFLLSRHRQRIENATICLVLALGKICLHRDPLPSVFDGAPDVEALFQPYFCAQNDPRDLAQSDPRDLAQSADNLSWPALSATNTPSGVGHVSTRGYFSPPGPSEKAFDDPQDSFSAQSGRNLDAIPGLAYYTAATDVLGSQADGTTLAHAQLFALAGLYKGQLARVRESISWISKAGQVVRLLLQAEGLSNAGPLPVIPYPRNGSRGRSDGKDAYRDAVKLTAWTILQLESDILAELNFPSSGLPALELVPYNIPDCSVTSENLPGIRDTVYTHEMVVLFYSAQTFLRTRLNNAHGEIYGSNDADRNPIQVREMLRGHDLVLTQWRTQLPQALRWEDDDPPSSNILHARLRAKYWGARYVITRPFLDFVMHIMPYISSPADVGQAAIDAQGHARDAAEVRLLEAIAGMPPTEIWAAMKSCIDAAMQSTVAFDGVPDRLVVTNIHGTAHAQFGNMLVLAAVYQHQNLRCYVPRDKLLGLLDRTISTLDRLAPISQTCKADCWILRQIRNSMFPAAGNPGIGLHGGISGPTPPDREPSCDSEIVVAPPNAFAPPMDASQGSHQSAHWT